MGAQSAILVVEDDAAVRNLLDTTLRHAGWRTLVAPDAGTALATANQYDGPIPLAILDIVMPDVGGLDLANELAMHRPDTKVLYISGYNSVALDSIRQCAPELMLGKPFGTADLIERVRKILAA